jgi:hypothetical protein
LPLAPLTVTVNVPIAAELLAVNVNVLVEEVAAGLKIGLAATPAERPEADNATEVLKPLRKRR